MSLPARLLAAIPLDEAISRHVFLSAARRQERRDARGPSADLRLEGLRAGLLGKEHFTWSERLQNPVTHPHAQACFGGLIFGIDTGVTGGTLRMSEFLERLHPKLPPARAH